MPRVNYSGLVIAGIGFFLTRFTVTLALYDDPIRFYFAGFVPLSLGLGLAAFGVALAVVDVDSAMVRTTARWCVLGTGSMLVLVVLTLVGSTSGSLSDPTALQSRAYLSNFLIGGSVGGTLTGLYAARNRNHRRTLVQQTHRLKVLNRLLRHEVLNAVTVIRGYATLDTDDGSARSVIERRARAIETTIEEVKYLTWSANENTVGRAVDVGDCVETGVETVRERHPAADISLDLAAPGATALANERLVQAVVHLVENAVVHADVEAPSVDVRVSATPTDVRVSVTDEGPGLPERQRALIEDGDIGEFDDPRTGFGLNVVRLLVESYGGRIAVDSDAAHTGTTVTLVLRRADGPRTGLGAIGTTTSARPAAAYLAVTLIAALLAGVLYGAVSQFFGGSVAAIGVFYGIQNPVVGWYTHEFHSVVFGFVYAALISRLPSRYGTSLLAHVAVGAGWSLFVYLVAASVVAPVWLQLLGFPAPLPNLSAPLLVSHLVWGVSLGGFTAWGHVNVAPRLTALGSRTVGLVRES